MNQPLQVDYYTDVLCVWAWIAQRRMDEIAESWGRQVSIKFHYINVFGDALGHIGKKWSDKGGCAGFAEHAAKLAALLRRSFFVDALDISNLPVILEIADGAGFDRADKEVCR